MEESEEAMIHFSACQYRLAKMMALDGGELSPKQIRRLKQVTLNSFVDRGYLSASPSGGVRGTKQLRDALEEWEGVDIYRSHDGPQLGRSVTLLLEEYEHRKKKMAIARKSNAA